MSDLTEIKEEFKIEECKSDTYLAIIEALDYYERHANTQAINAFLSLKNEMETKCNMTVIKRALNGHLPRHLPKPTPRKFTMRGMDIIEIHEDGTISFYKPEQKTVKIPEPLSDALLALRSLPSKELVEYEDPLIRNKNVPILCDPSQCEIMMCPARLDDRQHGKLCRYRTPPNQRTPQVDPTRPPTTPELRTLDPKNEPDYRSPKYSNIEKPKKPKKEMKESLSPM